MGKGDEHADEEVFYYNVTGDDNWAAVIFRSSSKPKTLHFINSFRISVDISCLGSY
jgi:hypothetical protein